MWRMFMLMSLVGVLASCDLKKAETAKLKTKVDSLETALQLHQNTMETLREVGALIDSIDVSRSVLRTRMIEGTSFDDYTARMHEINDYVKEAESRIVFLQNRIKTLNGSTTNYAARIEKLKSELEKRNQELVAMQETITKYRDDNDNLLKTVDIQEAEIADKLELLGTKENEIIKLEKNVSDLIAKSKIDEGETYYLRAVATEESANHIHFAPKRKANTRMEALELYKLAASYGKDEAGVKIAELEKMLNKRKRS